jgi:hypothetical protein
MKAAGFSAIFCNVGDFPPPDWEIIRENAAKAAVICGPWLRVAEGGEGEFDAERLSLLLDIADAWEAPYIVNAESELKDSGSELTSYIAQLCGQDDWALSMEPWPFATVDWTPIKKPVLPQIFGPSWGEDCADAVAEWHRCGVRCVVPTFGTYSGWQPILYDLLAPFGLYTADDCGNNFAPWSATGTWDPCEPLPTNGGDMADNAIPPISPNEIIGTEHGITALVDWLQKQPGMPIRTSSYNPQKPGTWPWPERLERALKILVADHDAGVPGA